MSVRQNASNTFFRIVSGVMTLWLFLLPLKFGSMAVMPEIGGFYPASWTDYIYTSLPAHSLGIVGAIMLLLALCVKSSACSADLRKLIYVWAILPVLAALPGAINGYFDESLGEIANLAGMGCFMAAAAILGNGDEKNTKYFSAALLLGGLTAAGYGIYQYFYGLDELRRFAMEQYSQGIILSDAIKLKLTDTRVFSTMASSNTFASLLLMTTFPVLFFAWKWSRRIDPPGITWGFFLLIAAGLIIPAMYFSGSRGIIFSLLCAAFMAALSAPGWKKQLKIIVFSALMIAALGIFIYLFYCGRSIASMGERADYIRSSAIMTLQKPFAGNGWGSFFRIHSQIKLSFVGESARDPHNVVAAFAGQCGVFSGLGILFSLLYPLYKLYRYRFSKTLQGAVFWSGAVFFIHSLIDCDWHVPALPAAMGIWFALAIDTAENTEVSNAWKNKKELFFRIFATFLAITSIILNGYVLKGDHALSRLQERLSPQSAESAAQIRHLSVEKVFQNAFIYRSKSAVVHIIRGDYFRSQQNWLQAEKSYLEALKIDPLRPGIYLRLAKLAQVQNKSGEVEAFLLKAHQLAPRNPKYSLEKLRSEVEKL